MLRAARKEIGLTTDQTIVIGDTMETDILGGTQLGFRTVLVLSGGTCAEDLSRYPYQPDIVVQSIGELDHGGASIGWRALPRSADPCSGTIGDVRPALESPTPLRALAKVIRVPPRSQPSRRLGATYRAQVTTA